MTNVEHGKRYDKLSNIWNSQVYKEITVEHGKRYDKLKEEINRANKVELHI